MKNKRGVSRHKLVAGLTAAALALGGSVVALGVTAPAANAAIVPCTVNFVIEQDITYSFSPQNLADTKAQLQGAVGSLEGMGIPVKAGVSSFGMYGNTPGAPKLLNQDIGTPAGNKALRDRIATYNFSSASNATSWQEGLRDAFNNAQIQGAKNIIFVTDGVPNMYTNAQWQWVNNGTAYDPAAGAAAKVVADQIRAAGITLSVVFVRSNQPNLHGLDDPVSPTPASTVTTAMQNIQPGWTIDKALSIGGLAKHIRDNAMTTCTAGVSLSMTHSGADYVDANKNNNVDTGDTVAFTFKVTNTGNTPLKNLVITDPKLAAAGVTIANGGKIANIAVNGSATLKSTPYKLTLADTDAGQFVSSASVTGTSPIKTVSASDGDTVPTKQAPAITLVKSHVSADVVDKNRNGKDDAGDTVAFTFVATNTGNVTLDNVVVTDPKLAAAGVALGNAGKIANLAPRAKGTIKSNPYTLKQADVEAGKFDNTATVSATSPKDVKVTGTDTDTVPADQAPAVKLAVSHGSADVVDKNGNGKTDAGDTAVFTYTATNTGNLVLSSVKATDAKLAAAGVTLVNGGKIANLAPGAKGSVKSNPYTLKQADVDAGTFTATGSVVGTSVKGNVTATGTDTVTMTQTAAIALMKSHSAADVVDVNADNRTDPGDTIVFTYVATNTGTVTLTNVTVSDATLAAAGVKLVNDGKMGNLAGGATATIKSQPYTLTRADADAGKFTSTGSVVGASVKGNVTATSTSSVTVQQLPKFNVVFDGNAQMGVVTGAMASIVVEYGCTTCLLPANGFTKSTGAPELIDHDVETAEVMSTFLGWSLDRMSRTGDIADRAVAGTLSRTDGATVRLYAIWDDAPRFIITSYPDRFFGLQQAKTGAITEAELLRTVKATDKETNPLAHKTSAQVQSSGSDVGVTLFDYDAGDFTSLTDSGVVSVTYKVKDELAHVAFLRIRVTVSDDAPLAQDATTYLRGISPQYASKGTGDGGLSADSLWKSDPTRKAALERALSGSSATTYCLGADAIGGLREQLRDPDKGMGNSKTPDGLETAVGVLRASGTCP
jgi:uncharacterized repeat protein (TIGR01451 family)